VECRVPCWNGTYAITARAPAARHFCSSGKCVPLCPSDALYEYGWEMTVDQVLAETEQDASFYHDSGGGITLSGGERTLQPDFSVALLAEAHRRGINTAIETAGNVPWDFFQHVDTVLHDHKLTDPARHKKWVGVDNVRIKENYKRAYEAYPDKTFMARTPVIPGVNDEEDHIRAVLAFIRPYKNVVDYQLLPYHRYGESKYGFLGRIYELKDFPAVPAETLHRLQAIIDEAFGRSTTGKTKQPSGSGESQVPALEGSVKAEESCSRHHGREDQRSPRDGSPHPARVRSAIPWRMNVELLRRRVVETFLPTAAQCSDRGFTQEQTKPLALGRDGPPAKTSALLIPLAPVTERSAVYYGATISRPGK